jgi:hypothetical protein
MQHDSMDRIREALSRLPILERAELRAEWLRLYETNPPGRIGRGPADGRGRLPLTGTDFGRIATPSYGNDCAVSPSRHAGAVSRY